MYKPQYSDLGEGLHFFFTFGKSEHCSLYIAFSRRNYYRPKSVPEIDEKVESVRCERVKRHVSMCVDVANVIAQSFHISLVSIL